MAKKRVHELAREFKIESKKMIEELRKNGIFVKSHMSTLEDNEIELVKSKYLKKETRQPGKSVVSVEGDSGAGVQIKPPFRAERSKDESGPKMKSPEQGIRKQENISGQKSDRKRDSSRSGRGEYSRGPGMVDRVPSRPPDRRFQERPSHPDKTVQQRGKDHLDRAPRPITSEAQKRVTQRDMFEKDRASTGKPYIERTQQDRTYPQGKQTPGPQHERRPQGIGKTFVTHHTKEKTEIKPSVEYKDNKSAIGPGGDRKHRPGGAGGQTAKINDPNKAGVVSAVKTKIDTVHPKPPQDVRFVADKKKAVDKPKVQTKTTAQKPQAKGRYEKRNEIARQAEQKLRSATSQRKKGPFKAPSSAERPRHVHQPVEKKPITIGNIISVQELAAKMHKSPVELIKKLMHLGVLATINQEIDSDTATILANEFGYEVEIKLPVDLEALLMLEPEEVPDKLQARPSVVTVMGHVDHGKTSLLDAIRETNVIATEAGGITQHIGAYQVEHNNRKITFVDTPGHEAFTAMRARGAKVTDIAILVVAADDGVMPQTVEAINHAKDANVPIIVAINKIDKPGANPERVKQELTQHGVVTEEWGGDTICVNVSALKKDGIQELLEMILLVAEMSELKSNPFRSARGTVIEAELDKGRGPVATVLVQNGTLSVGDTVIAGASFGRVRAMMDDKGRRIKKAGPSMPVEVLGFSEVPQAGDVFIVVEDEKLARTIVSRRQTKKREEGLKTTTRVSLEDLFKHIQEGQIKELGIIIKADVQGSVEALKQALEGLNTGEVKVNIIHGGVGAISETDIMLASASNAIIIGFNVRPDINARRAADLENVDMRLYRVIYDAIADVKAAMSGLLEPEYREVILGRAEIRKIYKASKIGTIAGCFVLEGKIERDASTRIVRDGIVIHEGKIDSLKRFKDDVKEVVQGYECGITLEKFNDIQESDIIEAFAMEAIMRQLS